MRSALLTLTIVTLSLCASCVAPRFTVTRPAAGCSSLIPEGWKDGVPGVDLPDKGDPSGWQTFGLGQTGQLEVANGRTRDSIEIVERCEARDAEAVREIERPWWRIWG